MGQPDQETHFTFDVRQVAVPAFGLDMDRGIIACNDAALRLFGLSATEMLGARCCDVIGSCIARESERAACCQAVANARRGRHTPRAQVLIATRDGARKRIELSSMIGHTLDGKRCLIHFARDVTTQHRVGEAVAQGLSRTAAGAASADAHHPVSPASDYDTPPAPIQDLTPREREVLSLLACGLDTHAIAATLSISPLTARNHVTRLMEKLGATTRLQAVLAASRLHLL